MKRDDRSTGKDAPPEPTDARESSDASDSTDPGEAASVRARERDSGEEQYEDARRAKSREDTEAPDPDDDPEERTLMERLNEALQRNRRPRG